MNHKPTLSKTLSTSSIISLRETPALPSASPPYLRSKSCKVVDGHSSSKSSDFSDISDGTSLYYPLSPPMMPSLTSNASMDSYTNHGQFSPPLHNSKHNKQRKRMNRHPKHNSFSSCGSHQQHHPVSMSSLSLLDDAPNTNLPSPVLTKVNSKVWNMADFDEYEKQLTAEIAAMKASHHSQSLRSMNYQQHHFALPSVSKHHSEHCHRSKHRKSKGTSCSSSASNASLSRQNSHLWTKSEMRDYQSSLLAQMSHYLEQ